MILSVQDIALFCQVSSDSYYQEALARTVNTYPGLRVEYDILLSPSYQVPVLYFTLRRGNNGGPVDRDTMYQYLVPEQYKTELTSVGVMGGISFDVSARASGLRPHLISTSRSIIQYTALRHFSFILATRRTR